MEGQTTNYNKSTSLISWIGFGLAITVFILIWFVNILLFNRNWMDEDAVPILYMLEISVGGLLGAMSLLFSIIGLFMAIKNDTPRWIGTSGIIICVLSILSFLIPIFCTEMIKNKTDEEEMSEWITSSDVDIKEDVTIQIFTGGRVRCINNKNAENAVVGNMKIYDCDFKKQLVNWLKVNMVDSTTGIIVNSTNDVSYSDITKVVETLNDNGITKIKLSSSLSIWDTDIERPTE